MRQRSIHTTIQASRDGSRVWTSVKSSQGWSRLLGPYSLAVNKRKQSSKCLQYLFLITHTFPLTSCMLHFTDAWRQHKHVLAIQHQNACNHEVLYVQNVRFMENLDQLECTSERQRAVGDTYSYIFLMCTPIKYTGSWCIHSGAEDTSLLYRTSKPVNILYWVGVWVCGCMGVCLRVYVCGWVCVC